MVSPCRSAPRDASAKTLKFRPVRIGLFMYSPAGESRVMRAEGAAEHDLPCA